VAVTAILAAVGLYANSAGLFQGGAKAASGSLQAAERSGVRFFEATQKLEKTVEGISSIEGAELLEMNDLIKYEALVEAKLDAEMASQAGKSFLTQF
jgi:hypothetical protein